MSGAEQDRYAAHFSGAGDHARAAARDAGDQARAAAREAGDQFRATARDAGDKVMDTSRNVYDRFSNTSGAEQDRYGAHFSDAASEAGDRIASSARNAADRLKSSARDAAYSARDAANRMPGGSGAEQDIYGSHVDGINSRLPNASDAHWFGNKVVDRIRNASSRLPRTSGAEQDRYGAHLSSPDAPWLGPVNPTAVGLLQSSVLPSLGLHAGLSALAYGASRYTNRVDGKDWLWPVGITANAWWSAIGARVVYGGLSLPHAWDTLGYQEKLMLAGVTAWGGRLLYRVASRSVSRGKDDERYTALKKEPGFWDKAALGLYLPEAIAQTLISLPFTVPFRSVLHSAHASPNVGNNVELLHSLAIFLFSTGFALEVVADTQLESHKKTSSGSINKEGVWSIVRHPNYLGDALIHASFPILLLSAGLLHPIVLAAPVANYLFLRYVGGDRQNEASQEERYAKDDSLKSIEFQQYKKEKNSFWPSAAEAQNKWTWYIVGAGVAAALVEKGFRYVSA